LGGLAPQLERDLDVLAGGQGGNELEGLEHEPDFLAAEPRALVLAEGGEVVAVEDDAPGRGAVEPRQQPEEGRLAAAGRADDGEEAAGFQRERDIFQDRELAAAGRVRLRERLAAQHGLQRRLPFSPSGMIAKNRGLLAAALALAACSSPRPSPDASAGPPSPAPNAPPAPDEPAPIVFLGTRLTA